MVVITAPMADAGGGTAAARVPSRRSSRGWPLVAVRVGGSLLAGALLLAAFPGMDLWWLAPVGVALLAGVTVGVGPLAGAGLGLLCGAALFVPLLRWTNLHTGWLPWLALSASQAVVLAALGGVAAWCSPLVVRRGWLLAPLTGAGWTAQEAVRDRVPFGGFPWGRLAFAQGDSPLLGLAGVGGAPLVTFVVASLGGALAAGVLVAVSAGPEGWRGGRWRRWGGPAAGGVAAVLLVAASGLVPVEASGSGSAVLRVAIVQGNVPRLGLDFNAQRRAVLDNHVRGTVELAQRVAAGEQSRPDLVVWPENSSDIDPLLNEDAAARIEEAAAAIGAPILVGAVLRHGERALNAGLLWQPGRGAEQRYIKRHPVPFAEYVPLRRWVRLITKQVDEVRVDFAPGGPPGVFRVGPVLVGDVICFEVAYDDLVRDVVRAGAGLIVVQTNNATFDVGEARQQLAMVRLRAVEHGRPALMASTVGVSAFVEASGRVSQSTGFFTAAVLTAEVRVGTGRTIATVAGCWPEVVIVAGLAVGVLAAGRLRIRRRVGSTTADPTRRRGPVAAGK